MDAPLYPPSRAYEQPAAVPHRMDTNTISIAALLADPAAKAIIIAEIPNFTARIDNEQLKPHLYNFSPRSLTFGLGIAELRYWNAAQHDRVVDKAGFDVAVGGDCTAKFEGRFDLK